MLPHRWRNTSRSAAKGFTLIELLVVIAIIGILSAVILSSLNTARERARNASYVAQIKEYQKALAMHYSVHGSYPGSGLWACLGIGYPSGVCWDNSSYNETNSTAVAFRNAVSPYIDATKVAGPTNRVYGTMYNTSGAGYQIILILEGDVACPMGTKITASQYTTQNVTRCNIFNQGT